MKTLNEAIFEAVVQIFGIIEVGSLKEWNRINEKAKVKNGIPKK